MNKIVLIGGSPTAGKSFTARKIAKDLGLPWISTDTIRGQMREIVRKEDYPALFQHSADSAKIAVEFLTNNSAKDIVKNQNKESKEVWKGVKAIIETDYAWNSFVIEGVAIQPCLVKKAIQKNKNVVAIFLVDENIERIRKTIFTRGLWNDAKKYPDSVKEKEVEWVLEFNEYIKKESKKYKFPVISIGNRKNYLKEIRKIIK